MATQKRKKIPSELRYFFLDKKLYKLLKVQIYTNLATAWDYSAQERVVYQWSDLQKDAKPAMSAGTVVDLLGINKVSLWRYQEMGLIKKPLLARGIGDTMVIDSYSGAVKWRWYSPDDVLDIHSAIIDYHKGNPGWRLPKFPTKAELVSKLNKTEVLYYKNEDGDFLPVWKAPNW
jgi:hypothetical protein